MKRIPGLKTLAILCIALFTGACAVERPPTGGPPDTKPLAVLASSPDSGAVGISPKSIRIRFNHPVTPAALRKAIFFSPTIRSYRVICRGSEAEIELYTPLRPSSTYTLTLARSLKGFTGTELSKSWTLPFSTGSAIDRESIEGTVWTHRMAPAANTSVLAYAVQPGQVYPDSLPEFPDYLTQTDASGSFRFESLSRGDYRIIALRDKNQNNRFDLAKDEFAVTTTPSVPTGVKHLTFRLTPSDTSSVTLLAARATGSNELEIIFSKPVPTRSISPTSFSILEKSRNQPLPVLECVGQARTEEDTAFRLLTGPMTPKSRYLVTLPQMQEKTELRQTPCEFQGSSRSVTFPELTVAILPKDKTVNVLPETIRPDAGPCIELQFNLPVSDAAVRSAVSLSIIRQTGQQPVPVTFSRYDGRTWLIRPMGAFEPGAEYVVSVRSITPIAGRRCTDALTVSRFSTAGPEQYGEISGTGSAREAQEVIVDARRQGTTTAYRNIVRTAAGGTFSFSFRNLPPGTYTVSAFIPGQNRALVAATAWKPGSVTPFRPAEPIVATSAIVRAGWTTATELPGLAPLPSRPAMHNARPVKKSSRPHRH